MNYICLNKIYRLIYKIFIPSNLHLSSKKNQRLMLCLLTLVSKMPCNQSIDSLPPPQNRHEENNDVSILFNLIYLDPINARSCTGSIYSIFLSRKFFYRTNFLILIFYSMLRLKFFVFFFLFLFSISTI